MSINFIGLETLKMKESVRLDMVNSAFDVLNSMYNFNLNITYFDHIKIKNNNKTMRVELRKAIRFVPENSVYYYNAVVYLNTNNVGLGLECNPANFDQNLQTQFFHPTEVQKDEINSIIQYLTIHHNLNSDTFFKNSGEITIYAQQFKYKLNIWSKKECLELEISKQDLF